MWLLLFCRYSRFWCYWFAVDDHCFYNTAAVIDTVAIVVVVHGLLKVLHVTWGVQWGKSLNAPVDFDKQCAV